MKIDTKVNKAKLMGEKKIPELVLKFAIPTIAAMLVNAIYNAADAMFVSWLGVKQSGAISVAFPIFMLILGMGLTFGTGAGSYISRLLGKEDNTKANYTASIAVFTSLIIALIFTIIGIAFINPVLRIAGATDTILPYAREYGIIIIAGCVFPIISRTFSNIIRAEGNIKYGSIVIMSGALLNIILDPIFIFFLDMGIKGAAYATILSQGISTVILAMHFMSNKSIVKINLKNFKVNRKIYLEILKIGLPTFVFQLLMSLSLGLINNYAAPFGDAAVAAMGIANRIFAIGMYIVFGFSQGFQPIAGFNYGAGKIKRLKESVLFSIKCTTIFSLLITILIFIFSKSIMNIFTKDLAVQQIGSRTLIALHTMFPLFGTQMIITYLFLALGKGKEGGFLSISRQGVFFLPMIIILPKLFDLNGVMYALPAADFLATIVAISLGLRLYKKEIKPQLDKTEVKPE